MKLVSPKTLLASLLGCVFVAMKVVTFDGIQDLFWIVLFGCLTIRGLMIAFSQEAYDADVKKARQGKALYRDLFGRFAYIAEDIPILLILLAGVLAAFCPVTTLLRVVLLALMLIAVGYVIWFSLYVSKHQRIREERGESMTDSFSEEEERAWKRSDCWHIIGLGIVVVLGALYLFFGDPSIYMNNARLKTALSKLDCDSVTLEAVVPFTWSTVYTFDPYTSIDRIEWVTGSNSPALKECSSEGMTHIVFMERGRVVASVCAFPSSLGYSLSFTGGQHTYYGYPDGGYAHIEYGDQVVFEVTRDDGFARLYAYVEE